MTFSLPVPSENSIRLISCGLAPLVAVVQAADLGNRNDLTGIATLHRTLIGWILSEREMRPRPIVVLDVAANDPKQLTLVERDDVIEAFAAKRSDESFRVGVLQSSQMQLMQ